MALLSFSAGLSGLNAHGTYMSVIGNNLANINTTGFKSSSVAFQDLVSQTLGGASDPMQVGLGVTTAAISPVFSQGTIENTRDATNVAIQGNGLFVVADPSSGAHSYTRAGAFSFDKDGRLVTPDNQFVQGYTETDPFTGAILATGALTDIIISPGVLRPPVATTSITAETNLDASTPAGGAFNSTIQIFDSLGAAHMANITFTRQAAAGTWSYQVGVPGSEIVGGTAGTTFPVATGTVAFNSAGVLTSVNGGAPADVAVTTPAWTNGAAASAWSWNLVEPDGSFTLTGFATASATSSIRQNGSAAGAMDNIAISQNGTITATFGAGQAIPIAQLATATFNNLKGLVKLGSNRYAESSASGNPSVGVPGAGGRGSVIGSALELSNVDIAHEFTQMILAQRGYQANSKTITTSDELLVDTLNMKR